ncbi:MAG: protein kinase [Planctomycetes bacterium]|nr:protein kinase [Planctomycetota bacterium]
MTVERPSEATIFNTARGIADASQRREYLDLACGADGPVRQRVEKLLAAHTAGSRYLEQPATALGATWMTEPRDEQLAAALEAGLAPTFGPEQALVLGNSGHSVLKSLERTVFPPRVALRESATAGPEPVTRPQSPEMPRSTADSRYQLQGEIARGGMGAIIKGRDTDLGRDLAIKVLLDQHKDKPDVIQRFIEEAQIGGQLQHPGIAPVYELGQFQDRRPFFSMKLVKGETLSKLLESRQVPSEDRGRFLGIFEQVCQTMAYAHSRGVIHRDLKPANIMVGAFGEVQVMDWGLAKVLSAGGIADEKKAHDKLQSQSIIQTLRSKVDSDAPGVVGTVGSQTQMGSVMGTPAYMPPEQALGEIDQMDERADVFGLGAILCEILTGKPPYVGGDGTQVYRMASRGKLSACLTRLDACGADPELIALTKNCLALEPKERPRDAGVLAERVTTYVESVETKLRETELERAAQMARADAQAKQAEAESRRAESEFARAQEERKRRRTSLALATSMLLLVGVVSSGWLYLLQQDADRIAVEADAQRRHAREMDEQRQMEVAAREKAEDARRDAENQRQLAEQRAETIRENLYFANMNLAGQAAVEPSGIGRVQQLLKKWGPDGSHSDLRGWEWYYFESLCQKDLSTLGGHTNGAAAVAWSPNGLLVATSDGGNQIFDDKIHPGVVPGVVKIWDAVTAEERLTLRGHRDIVTVVSWSPDALRLATSSFDGTVKIWNLRTGETLCELSAGQPRQRSSEVHTLHWSPNGAQLASAAIDGHITVWDAATGKPLQSMSTNRWNYSVSWSPDGSRLASAGLDVKILDVTTGGVIQSLGEHAGARVTSVCWSPDGSQVASAGWDAKVKVWDVKTGNLTQTLSGHLTYVVSVGWSPDGRRLASASLDSTIKIWEPATGSELQTLRGHADEVLAVCWSPDSARLASASSDNTVKIWDATARYDTPTVRGPENSTAVACWSPDGMRLASGSVQHTIKVWDVVTTEERLSLRGHTNVVTSVTWSPGGKQLASASQDGTVKVWDASSGEAIHTLRGPPNSGVNYNNIVEDVSWSPDGTRLAVSTSTGKVEIWDADSGTLQRSNNEHQKRVYEVRWSPDGKRLATASQDNSLRIWDAASGRELQTLRGHAGTVLAVAWKPDGTKLASGGVDKTIRIWDAETGSHLFTIPAHTGHVWSVSWSPDGERLASGSSDNTVKLWEVASGRLTLSLTEHSGAVYNAAWNADGQRLASASLDGSVKIWDATIGYHRERSKQNR